MNLTASVLLATVYGLCMRLAFDLLGPDWAVMSLSFLILAPALIGFLTVFLLPLEKVKDVKSAFFKPWWTTLAMLIITLAFSVEGIICWIMIYPFFSVLAGLGGISAYYIKDAQNKKRNKTNKLNFSLLILLPLLTGFIEKDHASQTEKQTISSQVIIDARPEQVWKVLTKTGRTPAQNQHYSLARVIGFPRHTSTTLDTFSIGGHRTAYYEKGLYFNETIKKYQPNASLVLSIKTDPEKISPKVMDEHIIIGGKHLDILEDNYQLRAVGTGKCELKLTSNFMICTPINWYSSFWAKLILNDIIKEELNAVQKRAALQP